MTYFSCRHFSYVTGATLLTFALVVTYQVLQAY
jgi:hypothetical protein